MRHLVGGLVGLVVLLALPADHAGAQSPPGSAGAKAMAKCQATVAKVNGKLVGQRLKRLGACSASVLGCLQTTPGNAACVTKATAKCQKQLGAADDAAGGKAETAVLKACGTLPLADLLAAGGLGFENTEALCGLVDDAADVARCLRLLHAGISERSFGAELPRAAELTAQGGVDASAVPDLPLVPGCGNCGGGGKALAACSGAITKAGAGFLAKTRSGLDKCTNALVGCAQTKPGDAGCLAKAKSTCEKLPGDLAKGRAKLLADVQKKCGGALGFATLQSAPGLNLGALACECQRVGVEPVATLDDYALCLTRQHECELAAATPLVAPSVDGLLAGQGLSVSDLLCQPATTTVAFAGTGPRAALSVFGTIKKFIKSTSPGSFRSLRAPLSTRGSGPRVGRPFTFGGCGPGPGRNCTFRFPIQKTPTALKQKRAGRAPVVPPTLVIGVQRADGEPTDDYYEVDLPADLTNDTEIDVQLTYADDLAACEFDLALAVQEDGEVSAYTPVEQLPHPMPANDTCANAKGLEGSTFTEVLDVAEATALGEPASSCADGGLGQTVWYEFTAPTNGIITADTIGSDFKSVVAVFTGGCGSTVLRTCAGGTPDSKIALPVVQGTTYLIQVGHSGEDIGLGFTQHFTFRFAPAGAPPTIAKLAGTLLEINSSTICSGNNGSAFRLEFDFEDADGDVLPTTAFAQVHAVFEPSGGVSDFPSPLESVTGDGFTGHASLIVCTFFSADQRVDTSVRLVDLAGAGNKPKVKLERPPGAN